MLMLGRYTAPRPVVARPVTRVGTVSVRGPVVRPQHTLGNVTNGATVFMMRHGKKLKKLNLPADQRKALLRSLVTDTIRYGSITTTLVRAKAAQRFVDRMITLAKNGSKHAKNQANAYIYDRKLVNALFSEGPARYADRNGGYTRVRRIYEFRRGDNAELAKLELVE